MEAMSSFAIDLIDVELLGRAAPLIDALQAIPVRFGSGLQV
jgi:hypothetical protein